MAEYSLGLINNTPNNHNPEEVGRCHSNAEDHHSGSTHNMVGEYHIMAHRKVPTSVWLVLAGHLQRLKGVASVHCHIALDNACIWKIMFSLW